MTYSYENPPIVPIDILMAEIRKEIAEKQTLIEVPVFKTDIWHEFKRKSYVTEILESGWSPPENHYCWMTGGKSQMKIRFEDEMPNFRLSVLAHPKTGKNIDSQNILVTWNDQIVTNWVIRDKRFYSALILNNKSTIRANTLGFECRTPISPEQCGESKDRRLLAFAIHKMSIKPI